MAPPTSRRSTGSRAAGSESTTAAPGPTGRRRTGKPSASSAHSWAAGPTARSIALAESAQLPLTAGFGTTTIGGDTRPSATNPRSAEPTCSGLTPSAHPQRGCLPQVVLEPADVRVRGGRIQLGKFKKGSGRNVLPFFFNDTATTEIYTLSLHDALPISRRLRTAVPGAAGRRHRSRAAA